MQSIVLNALLAISGLSTAVAAQALTTIAPCPSCPSGVEVAPITVTSQFQPVSTCSPVQQCASASVTGSSSTLTCSTVASCSTYDFVSTVIPYLGGSSSTLITKTDQVVTISHLSTVLTSSVACPTTTAAANATIFSNGTAAACSPTTFPTLIVDVTAPFNELGAIAIPGYAGSGLCTDCEVSDIEQRQRVLVTRCLDAACTTYSETWVYITPEPTTIVSEVTYTSDVPATQTGVNTITVTATFTPTAGDDSVYTPPVTTTFAVTTSVPSPQNVVIAGTVTVTFVASPQSSAVSSEAAATVSATTRVPSNGVYTIPVVTTIAPSGSFTQAVPTTVYITTTVTDGPQIVTVTQTVTVTFINIVINNSTFITVINGITQPASASATTTGTITSASTTGTITSASTTASASITPAPVADSATFTYVGCLGSSDGFSSFVLDSQSAAMDVDVCTSECSASGATYAGLFNTECYCSEILNDATTGTDQATGVCNIPCPGDASQTCGGLAGTQRRKRQAPAAGVLLDVYSITPTTTSSSTTETASETSATAEPSSDPDPAPEARSLNADLIARKVRDIKLRRGGLLRNAKSQPAPKLSKRDYSLKNLRQ